MFRCSKKALSPVTGVTLSVVVGYISIIHLFNRTVGLVRVRYGNVIQNT